MQVEDIKSRATALAENKRTLIGAVVSLFVLMLIWVYWPSGKPPAACDNGYKPGQLVQSFDQQAGQMVQRVMGNDCQLPAQVATPDEVKTARERMAKWQAYERDHAPEMPRGDMSEGSVWAKALSWVTGPIGVFFGVVFGLWAVLLVAGLLLFLVGFLVVAVIGLRHAPLLVVAAPVMVWWQLLIELPMKMCLRFLETAERHKALGGLQKKSVATLLELLGIRQRTEGAMANVGSARFADWADVTAADRQRGACIELGYLERKPLTWHTEKHVLILAGSREGKGRDLLVPNLLTYEGSMLVLDPKGEHYKDTSQRRCVLGTVRVLAPWGIQGVERIPQLVRFNPLKLVTNGGSEAVDIADVISHSLILDRNADPHWSDSARGLWRALMLHIATDPFYEGHRDLITARRVLSANFIPAKKEAVSPASQSESAQASEPPASISTIERMEQNMAFGGVIAEFAHSIRNTPDRERGSIISSALRQTDFLDTPAMRAALSEKGQGDELDFAEWRKAKPMTCYLSIPANYLEGSGKRWVRMVVAAALNEMMKELPEREKGERKPPVQFILEEIASLDRLEQIERALGLAAGFGVQLWAVWQDIPQMKDLYEKRWASFFGNAGARYMFGIGDYDTADYVSKLMGKATVTAVTNSLDAFGLQVQTQNEGIHERPLVTPDEVMTLPQDQMLVSFSGVRPVLAERLPWFEDERLRRLGGSHANSRNEVAPLN